MWPFLLPIASGKQRHFIDHRPSSSRPTPTHSSASPPSLTPPSSNHPRSPSEHGTVRRRRERSSRPPPLGTSVVIISGARLLNLPLRLPRPSRSRGSRSRISSRPAAPTPTDRASSRGLHLPPMPSQTTTSSSTRSSSRPPPHQRRTPSSLKISSCPSLSLSSRAPPPPGVELVKAGAPPLRRRRRLLREWRLRRANIITQLRRPPHLSRLRLAPTTTATTTVTVVVDPTGTPTCKM